MKRHNVMQALHASRACLYKSSHGPYSFNITSNPVAVAYGALQRDILVLEHNVTASYPSNGLGQLVSSATCQ